MKNLASSLSIRYLYNNEIFSSRRFEDTKGAIRSHQSKSYRQYNDQPNRKNKNTNNYPVFAAVSSACLLNIRCEVMKEERRTVTKIFHNGKPSHDGDRSTVKMMNSDY
jgi:hypothetical protein